MPASPSKPRIFPIVFSELEYGNYIELDEELFPDIIWDNSPKEITLNVDC